jgi:5-methylcytosine-specific restriction endonuclease McrA
MSAYDYRRWYDTARWRRLRLQQLQLEPLCQRCKTNGHIVEAEVVHHVIPHKGDPVLFWSGKLESLCRHCHDGITQQVERSGFSNAIGTDGWPVDSKHPVYNHR